MAGRKKFDKILVCDIETSCWATKEEQENQKAEIIQIGICSLVVSTGEIVNKKSYLIKPHYSFISQYCTDLTGITPKMAKSGMPLGDACNSIIKNFGPKTRVWASFGVGDKEFFIKECSPVTIKYPFSEHYIDISTLFHLKYYNIISTSGCVGLQQALKLINKEFAGAPHNAEDDAVNAAVLLYNIIGH